MICSLSSRFSILLLCIRDLLLNHRSNFAIPFEHPANCVGRKGEYDGIPAPWDLRCARFLAMLFPALGLQKPCSRGTGRAELLGAAVLQEAAGPAGAELPHPAARRHGHSAQGNDTFSIKYPCEAGGGDGAERQGCCPCLVIKA